MCITIIELVDSISRDGSDSPIICIRPVARLIERGVHVKNMQASGHAKYNLMCFKLSMLVLKYS